MQFLTQHEKTGLCDFFDLRYSEDGQKPALLDVHSYYRENLSNQIYLQIAAVEMHRQTLLAHTFRSLGTAENRTPVSFIENGDTADTIKEDEVLIRGDAKNRVYFMFQTRPAHAGVTFTRLWKTQSPEAFHTSTVDFDPGDFQARMVKVHPQKIKFSGPYLNNVVLAADLLLARQNMLLDSLVALREWYLSETKDIL